MPEFVYIGDGRDSPAYTTFKGVPFRLHGEPVNVEDAHIVGKLRGNRTFCEIVDGKQLAPPLPPKLIKDWIGPEPVRAAAPAGEGEEEDARQEGVYAPPEETHAASVRDAGPAKGRKG